MVGRTFLKIKFLVSFPYYIIIKIKNNIVKTKKATITPPFQSHFMFIYRTTLQHSSKVSLTCHQGQSVDLTQPEYMAW